MKIILNTLVLSLFLLTQAHAATQYKVEMIFFAQDDDNAFFSENWPLDTGLNGLEDETAEDKTGEFTEMESSEFTLAGAAKALEKSPRYTLLRHIMWEQPGLEESKALKMPIAGGRDYREEYPKRMQSRWEANEQGQMVEIPGPENLNELDGSVTLVLGRYLHIYTDLIFRKPVIVEQLDEETQEITETRALFDIPVQSHRRMRSRELHYLDHPMVGILIEVTPVETEEEKS
ncbi:MAG: CsiV family protein [Gammaproteobacteria bacterium]|nr:CsiV family protein [Gammaproteobacteria bacterium]